MSRSVKDSKLDSREARLKLKVAQEPYWRLIYEGLHLGYRKGSRGGVWFVRIWNGAGYTKRRLGIADDIQDCNGQDILSFKEAQNAAVGFIAPKFNIKNITVAEAAEHYMNWFHRHRKSYKSTETYLKAHILPYFGNRYVADLKARDIRAWHEALASAPNRKRTAKGIKQKFQSAPETEDQKRCRKASANRMLTVLKALLNKAYQDELVQDDSAWRRVKPFGNVDEPVVRFLTEDEALRLINACNPDFQALVKAALFTGARYSELANLKVGDVSLDMRKILIRVSKSGKGRYVPLSLKGLDFFSQQMIGKTKESLIFTRMDGTPWKRDYQHRPIRDACNKAQIAPSIGFHELRHTYASLMAQGGADLLTISKLLGHADTRITARHYAHLCDKTLANAVETFLPEFGHVRNNLKIVENDK